MQVRRLHLPDPSYCSSSSDTCLYRKFNTSLDVCGRISHGFLGLHNEVFLGEVVKVSVDVGVLSQINAKVHTPAGHKVQISVRHGKGVSKEVALAIEKVVIDVGEFL